MVGQCPNCGAFVSGSRCEYCGTVFIDEEFIRKELAVLKNKRMMLNMELVNQNTLHNMIRVTNQLLDRPARPMF